MTDASFQMIASLATLAGIVINTIMVLRTKADVLRTKADVRKIELATNSMKDALVKTTAEAAEFKGAERGRIEQTAERKAEKEQ
jgi:hypothetical protein